MPSIHKIKSYIQDQWNLNKKNSTSQILIDIDRKNVHKKFKAYPVYYSVDMNYLTSKSWMNKT